MDDIEERATTDVTDWQFVLYVIVEWLCCCLRNDTNNGGLLTHISEGYDAIRNDEGVALLAILLSPIWIILGILSFFFVVIGSVNVNTEYAIIGKI